jgi:hypothetical protein
MKDWITRSVGRWAYGGRRPSGAAFRSHVTSRGALLGMFAVCLLSCVLAAWLHAEVVAGVGFVASGILAPVYARRDALLHIVIAAPVIFLLAEVGTQLLTAQGSSSRGSAMSVIEGTFLTLADVAPWLFSGTAICVGVATMRGLPQCVRDLRAGLRGEVRSADLRGEVRATSLRRG